MDKGLSVKGEIIFITIYKLIDDILRFFLGILLILFNFDLHNAILYFFKNEIVKDPNDLFFHFLMRHVRENSINFAQILALLLIIFAFLEIIFLIGLILRKKWGGIGFFCMQFVWVPVDLMIISKFLLFSKVITIILDLVIIWFMIRLLISPKGYFKK
jgi:uncharacterized membrane protein (DUF2068 family)